MSRSKGGREVSSGLVASCHMIWQGVVCAAGQGLGRNDDVLLLSLWRTQPRFQEQNSGPECIALASNPQSGCLTSSKSLPPTHTQDGVVGGGLMSGPWGTQFGSLWLSASLSRCTLGSRHISSSLPNNRTDGTGAKTEVRRAHVTRSRSRSWLGPHRGNVESQTSALTSTT